MTRYGTGSDRPTVEVSSKKRGNDTQQARLDTAAAAPSANCPHLDTAVCCVVWRLHLGRQSRRGKINERVNSEHGHNVLPRIHIAAPPSPAGRAQPAGEGGNIDTE